MEVNTTTEFRKLVETALERAGMRKSALARGMGITPQNLNIMLNNGNPRLETMLMIWRVLASEGVEFNEVVPSDRLDDPLVVFIMSYEFEQGISGTPEDGERRKSRRELEEELSECREKMAKDGEELQDLRALVAEQQLEIYRLKRQLEARSGL
ncbi:helix-turn-helix transcriptional regulator [Limibacter armeniacum]|uniref:helix-turn-helix domain-containing protein n=1 Tax=Limibacter armeniacum TaxID=466084 RepID=UPI002FE575F2